MEETEGFGAFVAIVEAGSVSAASRELGVPRATLSRRLSRLEARLGVRLLHRSTRHLALTLAGEELHRRASRIQQQAREAEAAVQRLDGVPRGLLRVSVPPLGLTPELSGLLSTFLLEYPEVQLEVSSNVRHVDLAREGYDVALRAGQVHDQSLITRRLGAQRVAVFGSERTIERLGAPQAPEDLARFDCIGSYDPVSGRPRREWPLLAGGTVSISGRLATNDLQLVVSWVRDGPCLGLVPIRIMERLAPPCVMVPVLTSTVGIEAHLWVVYPDRHFLDPKVRALVDHLVMGTDAIRLKPPEE